MAQNPIFRIFGRDESAEAWASVQRNASTAIGRINSLLPGLGAALTAAGMVAFAKQALESAEQLNVLSQRTGIAVEELSTLKFAGEQANVGIEELALGIKKLSSNAFAAADANSEAGRTFKQLGVSATDASGNLRPTRDLLLDMAARFSKMEDGAAKTALAVKVFGKTGDQLIPFLNQGKDGIARLTIEAERLGLVMSKESAEAANKFNDNMKALGTTATALGIALVNATAPAMSRITEAMREALAEAGPLKALWIGMGGVLAESLGMGMKEASEKARDLQRALSDLIPKQAELNRVMRDNPNVRTQAELNSVNAQISAARNQLKALQAQIATERKQTEKNQQVQLDIESREKDQKAADAFIATLRKEADTYGMSKEAIIRYNAAKLSASFTSVDIAIKLRNETDALAKNIAANREHGEAIKNKIAALKSQAEWIERTNASIDDAIEAGEKQTQADRQRRVDLEHMIAESGELFDQDRAATMQRRAELDADDAARRNARAVAVFQSLQTESAAIEQDFVRRSLTLKEWITDRDDTLLAMRERGALTEDEFNQKRIEANALYYDAMKRLDVQYSENKLKLKSAETQRTQKIIDSARKGELSAISELFAQAVPLMRSKSRTMFEIGKGAAIAEATVSTYQAINNALAVKPFWVGLAMASFAAAKGFANVAAIKSATFGGGGGSVPTFDANPSTGLPTGGFESPPSPISQPQVAPRQQITVQLLGSGRYTAQEIRDLIEEINQQLIDGSSFAVA